MKAPFFTTGEYEEKTMGRRELRESIFQLLFMTEKEEINSLSALMGQLGDWVWNCVGVIRRDYRLNQQDSEELFQHMWLHAYGIGALCATGVCRFSDEEISVLLSRDFRGQMYLLQADGRIGKG